jgi:amino acid transporter
MNDAEPAAKARGRVLYRTIELRNLFTLAFGAVVGIGWIIVVADWLTRAGAAGAIAAFVTGGAATILVAMCYAEIATALPMTGGEVTYASYAFGPVAGLAAGWFLALLYTSICTFEAISIGWVATALIPALEGPVLYTALGKAVHVGSLSLGLGGMTLITFLNYVGARNAASFQDYVIFAKVLCTVAFVVVACVVGNAANLHPLFAGASAKEGVAGFLAVLAITPFWLAGFGTIAQAMGEKRDGSLRFMGPMLVALIATATAFYVLVIFAAAIVVPRNDLISYGLPIADALGHAATPFWRMIVLLAALAGLAATWNAMFFGATRVLFALGQGTTFPKWFGDVHPRHGTPYHAVIFVGAVGAAGAFLGRDFITPVIGTGGIIVALMFLIVSAAVLRLRYSEPDLQRPFRVPGGNVIPITAILYATVMLGLAFRQSVVDSNGGVPVELALLAGWSALGVLLWLCRRWRIPQRG